MLKTWDDIVAFAYRVPTDPMELDMIAPLFHQAVTLVERGDLTREQALTALALGLGEIATDQSRRLVEEMNRKPFSPVILPRP
jgi:hypothetical protein